MLNPRASAISLYAHPHLLFLIPKFKMPESEPLIQHLMERQQNISGRFRFPTVIGTLF